MCFVLCELCGSAVDSLTASKGAGGYLTHSLTLTAPNDGSSRRTLAVAQTHGRLLSAFLLDNYDTVMY